ncbi:MAG TPA: hypothetical protein VFF21_00095 [Flavobacteriaceae bacterium]|nr:hypothetical protein [Flavobacteriaceae bacterium]
MGRKCKICKKNLYGRADKIFCDAACKNEYHKKVRRIAHAAAIEINSYLKRNYIILREILGKNKVQIKVSRNVLENKNFHFLYHTHFHINSKNKMYRYVYDICWMEFSDDEVLIIR